MSQNQPVRQNKFNNANIAGANGRALISIKKASLNYQKLSLGEDH
jgi:hypothetical protein